MPSQLPSHYSPHLSHLQSPPPHGFFKINVDGADSNDNINSSIRVIIRDSHILPLVAMSKLLPMPYLAEVTEALALQQGVQLASKMKLSQTIFEFDVLSLAQALNFGEDGGE